MNNYLSLLRRTAIAVLVLTTFSSLLSSCESAEEATTSPTVYSLDSKPYGKTYAEWSAEWWKWAYGAPAFSVSGIDTTIIHPLFDMTGAFANTGQSSSSSVYFIGGSYSLNGMATRSITISSTQSLFFPVLNVAFDTVGTGPLNEVEVGKMLDTLFRMELESATATLDGNAIADVQTYLARSAMFNFVLPDNSLYQLNGVEIHAGTSVPAISDGVWLMLYPLSKGSHVLKFKGVANDGGFVQDITYNITVN